MKAYKFTAFEPTGELIIEETWNFESDEEAKRKGEEVIAEEGEDYNAAHTPHLFCHSAD